MAQPEAARVAPADAPALDAHADTDPALFGTLYERYRGRIYTYLRSRTTSEEDAADLTQYVFVEALAGLARGRSRPITTGAWLFGIAHHVAVDFQRRRRVTVPWDLVPEALQPAATEDPTTAMVEQEAQARLRELLIALKPESRELLALRFVGRLTALEIATVIGASEAATRKRLARLLQSMKERYDAPTP
jgi:RNA polymerase sigma-70 factor, ECF subfamily